MQPVIIIGAGLSGLTTAYQLNKAGYKCLVLEARALPGGRIKTLDGPIEMGATWLGNQHEHLRRLLQEMKVELFEQFTDGKISYEVAHDQPVQVFDMPQGQAPSYRIKGGTSTIIQELINRLSGSEIMYNCLVDQINEEDFGVSVVLKDDRRFSSKYAVITTPPQLTEAKINFEPALSDSKRDIMKNTHTWMGESIKYAVRYKNPFWKEKGFSGMGFSQAGILQEVHDHCDYDEKIFVLKGFLNPNLRAFRKDDREKMVVGTLTKLFGEKATQFIGYHEHVWQHDHYTSIRNPTSVVPHQNNGHSNLRDSMYNGKLIFSGTESSPVYAGYMDGAVYSGFLSAKTIIEQEENYNT
ncbi:flavin monoamine oxidase family protein [Roseivirga sp.]|uniref:flavin monoamine oxidase family protein n=1 Tax=Roseivirga sp. TaxID=1964215 RepID=UPI003B8B8C8E